MTPKVTRSEWRAKSPKSRPVPLPWSMIDTVFVHYTAAESDRTGDPKERMRGIQRFHQNDRGWNDIAYNQAFTKDGVILEGRGWGVLSAATGAENDHSQAVVFLGADKAGRDDVMPKGREALKKLIREAIAIKKSKTQTPNASLQVRGHTEAPGAAGSTECPGAELLAFVHFQNRHGWTLDEPKPRYPRRFFLFAEWYLGEGRFKPHGPHNLKMRPKQLPRRGSPQMIPYMVALRHFLRKRKNADGKR